MKKALTEIITINKEGFTISMSIVEKQNNTGIIFNERLLVLNEGHFFGYISSVNIKSDPQSVNLKNLKESVQINCIRSLDHDQNTLTIRFIQIEKGRQVDKHWVFKMASEQLVTKWFKKMQEEKSQRSRRRSSEKKSKKDREIEDFSKEKQNSESKLQKGKSESNKKLNAHQQSSAEKQKFGATKDKNDMIPISQRSQVQFENPLYCGYDSMESQQQKQQKKQQPQKIQTKVNSPPPGRTNNLMQQKSMKKNDSDNCFIKIDTLEDSQIKKVSNTPPKLNKHTNQIQFNNPLSQDQISQANRQSHSKEKSNHQPQRSSMSSHSKDTKAVTNVSYVQMIQKIVKQSNQKTKEKQDAFKEQQNASKNLDRTANQNLDQDKQSYPDSALGRSVLQEFVNYKHGQANQYKKANKISEETNEKTFSLSNGLSLPKKSQEQQIKRKQQLQIVQKYALNLKKDILRKQNGSLHNLQQQEQKKIANFIRNKNFEQNLQGKAQDFNGISKSQLPFSYRYLLHLIDPTLQDQITLFADFRQYCENILKEIIDGMNSGNDSQGRFKAKVKKDNMLIYEYEELQIKIATATFKTLNQSKSEDSGQKIVKISDYSSSKDLQIQFKNYECLFEYLESDGQKEHRKQNMNSSRLKVPLITLVQYNGFISLFKVNSKFSHHNQVDQHYIRQKAKHVTSRSNVALQLIGPQSKALVLHIDEQYYSCLYAQCNKHKSSYLLPQVSFNFDIIQQLDSFLPRDELNKNLDYVFRKQFIEQIAEQEEYNQVVLKNPVKSSNNGKKNKQEKILQHVSSQILNKLAKLIGGFDELLFYSLHPNEISNIFHRQGVNMRYLGLAYDNLNEPFAKKGIMTQLIARTCKLLYRNTLQDIYINQNPNQSFNLKLNIIDFLNCIIGLSSQTIAFWQLLQVHAQYYFRIDLNKDEVDKGQLIIGLAHHCKLDLDWKNINPELIFKTEEFFNESNLKGTRIISKSFEPIFSQSYKQLCSIVQSEASEREFKIIVQKLNLNSNRIPFFSDRSQSPLTQPKIKKYLAHFVQPESLVYEKSLSHLQIFSSLTPYPSRQMIDIKILELKWFLRFKKRQRYLRRCEQFISMSNKFYGDYHPIMSELYDMFSNFHLQNGEYEDAITFAKSSLVNTLKICGTNHKKTAESYYNLSLCYIKANKKQDATNLLKKAKFIFQAKQQSKTSAYATINLKLSILQLNKGDIDDCIKTTEKVFQIYENILNQTQGYEQVSNKNPNNFEDEKTQALQILSRCYELKKDKKKMSALSSICKAYLPQVKHCINAQKVMRIALFPILSSIQSQDACRYLDIISQIKVEIVPKTYHKAYGLLKKRIQQNSLVKNLEDYLENFSSIDDYISINQSLKNWPTMAKQYQRETVNDFISLTQEILFFLGQGFLSGSLRQNL